jgi:hypothetical protein
MFLLGFALLGWFICLLGHESFRFVPCIPPFFGALIYLWLVRFHQQIIFEKTTFKIPRNFERIEHALLTQAIVTT